MGILNQEEIRQLHDAAVNCHLADSRDGLLVGIDRAFVATLVVAQVPAHQLFLDLHALNDAGTLQDGTVPLETWLQNAILLAGPRTDAVIFRELLYRHRRPNASRTQLQLIFDGAYAEFDDRTERIVQRALAQFLGVPPESVRILAMQAGSIKLTIELSEHEATALIRAFARRDPKLLEALPLVLRDVRRISALDADNVEQAPPPLDWKHPGAVLAAAVRTVPVVKYALGVAGVAAVVTIATRGFGLDRGTAVVGTTIVIAFMLLLLIMAVAARQQRLLRAPAMVFTWSFLLMAIGSSALLLLSFFFHVPKSPRCLFYNECVDNTSPPPPSATTPTATIDAPPMRPVETTSAASSASVVVPAVTHTLSPGTASSSRVSTGAGSKDPSCLAKCTDAYSGEIAKCTNEACNYTSAADCEARKCSAECQRAQGNKPAEGHWCSTSGDGYKWCHGDFCPKIPQLRVQWCDGSAPLRTACFDAADERRAACKLACPKAP